jgi:hypothetical protein
MRKFQSLLPEEGLSEFEAKRKLDFDFSDQGQKKMCESTKEDFLLYPLYRL